ncbi:6218_t:CDS:2 [Paraglomus occultum]|uniref:6218_t:CDS:1 n=1 Tax=Paraglomus occultum TaxID=144539 RepID=A0A9N8VM69_9GLOM|nr:6218_t:CDS:2 [Paraglomus occultum]
MEGEPTEKAFAADIEKSKTVSHLRKLIWEERQHTFSNVDATELTLWAVSVPIGDGTMQIDLAEAEKRRLLPRSKIANTISDNDLTDESFYIVIEPPTVSLKRTFEDEEGNETHRWLCSLEENQEKLNKQILKSQHTITSAINIGNRVAKEGAVGLQFFNESPLLLWKYWAMFRECRLSSQNKKLSMTCSKEADTQEKFNKFFALILMQQNPWVLHDASTKNYLKDPTAKIDIAILDGNIPLWPQLVSAIELKHNLVSDHHEALGQLVVVDRFGHMFDFQQDRKFAIGAIASDSHIEFIHMTGDINSKVLGYVSPEDERHLVDRIGDKFKFKSLISRRPIPSDQGTFVAVVTDHYNEKAVFKASTDDDEHIILENLAILEFLK